MTRRPKTIAMPGYGPRNGVSSTAARYWRISLLIGAAVIGVVALLLTTLARTVNQINSGAAAIWNTGKLIANNTIHVPLIVRTNQIVDDIIDAAGDIARESARIRDTIGGDTSRE